jgi:hypothetical protein
MTECPVCSKDSIYLNGEDRFFHRDGSDNQECWRAMLRGRPIGWTVIRSSNG